MIVGVDPSSLTIAVAVLVNGDIAHTLKRDIRKKGSAWNPQTSFSVYEAISSTFYDDICVGPDDSLFLEEPVLGVSVKATIVQSYVSGMIQSIVSSTGCRVALVNNKKWKKLVVGNGNAKKEDTIRSIRGLHPRAYDLCGDDDDLYDAVGLALYGANT